MIYAKKVLCGVLMATSIAFVGIGFTNLYNKTLELSSNIETNNKKITKLVEELDSKISEHGEHLGDIETKISMLKDELGENAKIMDEYKNRVITYNPSNIKVASNITTKELDTALEGTGLEGLGYAYRQAEKEYGINALFLVGLTSHESGWGQSRRARENNNLSGYAVYNDASKGKSFRTKFDCIMTTANLIHDEYLSKDGSNYNGSSVEAISKMYVDGDG